MSRLLLIPLLILTGPLAAAPLTDAHGDPLPKGAVARLGTIRYRLGEVGEFALSPDGKTLAAESSTGVFLWDIETGLPTGVHLPFSNRDSYWTPSNNGSLIFTADGKTILRVQNQVVRAYDVATGKLCFNIGLAERGLRLSAVPGTSKFAVVFEKKGALVFDTADGRTVSAISTDVELFQLTPTGKAYLSIDKFHCKLVNAETGKIQTEFQDTEGADEFAVSRDDRHFYAARSDGRLQIYDTVTGNQLEDLAAPGDWEMRRNEPVGLALSPDGTVAYLSRAHRPTFRRDLKAGKWLEPLPVMPRGRLIPHPDGNRVLFVGGDGLLRRFDVAAGREIAPPDGFEDEVTVTPSPDGRLVAATSSDGRVDVFDISGRLRWSLREDGNLSSCAWAPDGRTLACVTHYQIAFRDPATGRSQRVLTYESLIDGLPKSNALNAFDKNAAFTPSGDRLLLSFLRLFDDEKGDRVIVIDPKAGRRIGLLKCPTFSEFAVSPLGPSRVAVQSNFRVEFFDLANREMHRTASTSRGENTLGLNKGITFSPDGSFLLTWDINGAAVLRDPDTGQRIRKINVHQNKVQAFAFSPDGLWLATGGANGLVALWDVVSGDQVWALNGHPLAVTSLGFAGPRKLVTGSLDLTALVWDLRPERKPKTSSWETLASNNARLAYEAIWAIADDPAGPELLRSKIPPLKPTSAESIRQLVADLGAPRYAVREAATTALRNLGRLAESDLRTTRAKTTDEEIRSRLDGLLVRLTRERTAAEVVNARAVAAMELAATAEAKKLLAEWAAGASGARLTIDARAALARMNR
jgi:WD40 repeat protein